jgi:tetratricopeptide (TPR) repeat protein
MKSDELWQSIVAGLPATPSPKNVIPLPEILRVIEYTLDDRVEKYDLAIQLLDCISHLRNDAEFLNFKAMIEYLAKKYIRSTITSEQILEVVKNPSTYFNAGRAAYKANLLEKSLEYFDEALRLNPDDVSTKLDRAVTICTMGDFEKAFELICEIDKTKYDYKNQIVVEFNKGWHYIRKGDFKKGMELLHLGRELKLLGTHTGRYDRPEWDGTTHPGKTILFIGEGGIGDEVINARFVKTVNERGMNVIMSTVHNNQSMLSSIKNLKVIDSKEIQENREWDYWVPCMALPHILRLDAHEIPNNPYLTAKPEYVKKWSNIIKSDKKINIGVRWMGNPLYELELARTVPVEFFDEISKLDVQLFSIQKDDGVKNFRIPHNTYDIAPDLENWDDTMGAIMNLDLIITSCTSIAHVAAALGKPTWVVMPLLPYYTWADMKKESYWYKTVRCYRQKVWKDWKAPCDEVKKDLINLLGTK